MNCIKCGTENEESSNFCGKCGNRLAQEQSKKPTKPASKKTSKKKTYLMLLGGVFMLLLGGWIVVEWMNSHATETKKVESASSIINDKTSSVSVISDNASSVSVISDKESPLDQLHWVKFEQLGSLFDRKNSSRVLAAKFKKMSSELADDNGVEDHTLFLIRQVKTDGGGTLLLTRSKFADNYRGLWHYSLINAFDVSSSRPVSVPGDRVDSLGGESASVLMESSWQCKNSMGTGCHVRNTRYAVDQNNRLKYIVSILYEELYKEVVGGQYEAIGDGSNCSVEVVASRVNGISIIHDATLTMKKEIKCTPPPSSVADPFQFFSEQELMSKLGSISQPIASVREPSNHVAENIANISSAELWKKFDSLINSGNDLDAAKVMRELCIKGNYSDINQQGLLGYNCKKIMSTPSSGISFYHGSNGGSIDMTGMVRER
jgi:hypothetical protein